MILLDDWDVSHDLSAEAWDGPESRRDVGGLIIWPIAQPVQMLPRQSMAFDFIPGGCVGAEPTEDRTMERMREGGKQSRSTVLDWTGLDGMYTYCTCTCMYIVLRCTVRCI